MLYWTAFVHLVFIKAPKDRFAFLEGVTYANVQLNVPSEQDTSIRVEELEEYVDQKMDNVMRQFQVGSS